MNATAKIFMNGRSQAVRLPAEFRFEGKEVYIRRDLETGDVILSTRPADWGELFDLIEQGGVPEDFLDREERRTAPHNRDPLE